MYLQLLILLAGVVAIGRLAFGHWRFAVYLVAAVVIGLLVWAYLLSMTPVSEP